jgi:hypothetical protein
MVATVAEAQVTPLPTAAIDSVIDREMAEQHIPGFRAQMSRYPDDSLAIIVLTNASQADPLKIEAAVARVLFRAAPASH